MIRKNTIDCKLIVIKHSKKSGFDLIEQGLTRLSLEDEICPSCGLKGSCHYHASYKRYLVDFKDGEPTYMQLTILRVICSCGSSHAILSDPIIPYVQYSLFYILTVLAVYSCHIMTIEHICETYSITPSMLYRWLGIYEDHRLHWQGILERSRSDIMHSLFELSQKKPFKAFAILFIQTTNFSFLQTHANPANCQRNLQYSFLPEASHIT